MSSSLLSFATVGGVWLRAVCVVVSITSQYSIQLLVYLSWKLGKIYIDTKTDREGAGG